MKKIKMNNILNLIFKSLKYLIYLEFFNIFVESFYIKIYLFVNLIIF